MLTYLNVCITYLLRTSSVCIAYRNSTFVYAVIFYGCTKCWTSWPYVNVYHRTYSVLVTCLKLISNVLSVYQRTCWIFHTSACVGGIHRSVTGPLLIFRRHIYRMARLILKQPLHSNNTLDIKETNKRCGGQYCRIGRLKCTFVTLEYANAYAYIPCFGHSHLMSRTSFSNWHVTRDIFSNGDGIVKGLISASSFSITDISPLKNEI